MNPKWVETPFESIPGAKAWARSQDLLIEPYRAEGYLSFKIVDEDNETLVAQGIAGGPVRSLTRPKPKWKPVPLAERILELGEDPPWRWSPALSSMAAVERLFNETPVLKGDYIAYRRGAFVHEYVITWDDQVYQRMIICRED